MKHGGKKVLVLGGGFAGLNSAVGAARKCAELGLGPEAVDITLVDRNDYHAIRVRNYEEDLSEVTIPFAKVLDPVGVTHLAGDVSAIDVNSRFVEVTTAAGARRLPYDRLVLGLGSQLYRPAIPGLAEHGFDIDTYAGAARLAAHLAALASRAPSQQRNTVLVVGAGLTGIELATELPKKLRQSFGAGGYQVILADAAPVIGSDMGEHARPIIAQALVALGIETRLGIAISSIDAAGATLKSGEVIPAATIVWCAGMRASPLTSLLPVERDRLGRVAVDDFMRMKGAAGVFAAGDCAWSLIDGTHPSVMSCQHGRPMGRFAGHNVIADLLAEPMLPLRIDWYTTILDLGEWGALYTAGRDRQMLSSGAPAKKTKQIINRERIYPPPSYRRDEIFANAAPVVSPPPVNFQKGDQTLAQAAPATA